MTDKNDSLALAEVAAWAPEPSLNPLSCFPVFSENGVFDKLAIWSPAPRHFVYELDS